MLLNVRPLLRNRDYLLLFIGQMVSYLGSMVSYVAVPYQVYQLTQSSLWVGALGGVQLVPLVFFGLYGGSVADRVDRRRLVIWCEAVMAMMMLGLAANSLLPHPSVVAIFALSFVMQAVSGFHRPSLEAMTQAIVESSDYAAISALQSLRGSVGAIAGPALGGLIMAWKGAFVAYLFDFATFGAAAGCVAAMRSARARRSPARAEGASRVSHAASIREGLRYAASSPVLIGTYLIDIVAMTFAFPVALFPEMAVKWGGATAAGALFSAMSIGGLVITLFSGWTSHVRRHGAMLVYAATAWGLAVIALGFARTLPVAVACLALAGLADTVSAFARSTIWNETIPNDMRGRLAGIEMISYMTGPLLGNLRAGSMAAATSVSFSIWSGGIACTVAVVVCALGLPGLWRYRSVARPGP